MNNATLLDRLAHLSAQRTARTDRLHEVVQVFLAALAPHMQVGDVIRLDEKLPPASSPKAVRWAAFRLVRVDSARGPTWAFRADRQRDAAGLYLEDCDPTRPIAWTCPDEELPLPTGPSLFRAPTRGPLREDLILLAENASRFVAQLVVEREQEERSTTAAIAKGQKAIADAHSGLRP